MKVDKITPSIKEVLKGSMEALDYIEAQAAKNAAFRLETMDLLNKRGHGMLALLLGGAGAAVAYAMGRLSQPGGLWSFFALLPLAFWWFGLAAWVAVRVCRTQLIYPPTNEPKKLLDFMDGPLQVYRDELVAEGTSPGDLLELLRRAELTSLQGRIDGYIRNNAAVADRLDKAYLLAALSPVWAMVGIGIASVVNYFA